MGIYNGPEGDDCPSYRQSRPERVDVSLDMVPSMLDAIKEAQQVLTKVTKPGQVPKQAHFAVIV